jgi:glycosyltransferase involved in cell wall biosynthesis
MTKKRILIIGPVCNVSGYSEHARMFADAFLEDDNFDTYIIATQWANATTDMRHEKKYIECIKKTQMYLKYAQSTGQTMQDSFECCYQVRPPNEFESITNYDIGVTAALETVSAPIEWIQKCNMMKKILVVSEHAKKNLENTKDISTGQAITAPIEVIPFYNNLKEERQKFEGYGEITTDVNFLCVSQFAPRKNLFEMIKSFVDEFKDDEDVGLILKTHIQNNSTIDRSQITDVLSNFVGAQTKNRKCKVYLIHGNLNEEEMQSLYDKDTIKGYISATHGEGFGIPIFNAVCADIPVIATSWSGHMDFLSAPVVNEVSKRSKVKNLFLKVPYLIDKVKKEHLMPGLINEGAKWAYPNMKVFRKNLRALASSRGFHAKEAKHLGQHVRESFTRESVLQKIIDSSIDAGENTSTTVGDMESKSMHTIQHTTVMMNMANQITEMSKESNE